MGETTATNEHPWVHLCDLAYCSPDFDVVHRLGRDDAVEWLASRLADHGQDVPLADITQAYDDWPPDGPWEARHFIDCAIFNDGPCTCGGRHSGRSDS